MTVLFIKKKGSLANKMKLIKVSDYQKHNYILCMYKSRLFALHFIIYFGGFVFLCIFFLLCQHKASFDRPSHIPRNSRVSLCSSCSSGTPLVLSSLGLSFPSALAEAGTAPCGSSLVDNRTENSTPHCQV